jgi:hypothetical protein
MDPDRAFTIAQMLLFNEMRKQGVNRLGMQPESMRDDPGFKTLALEIGHDTVTDEVFVILRPRKQGDI